MSMPLMHKRAAQEGSHDPSLPALGSLSLPCLPKSPPMLETDTQTPSSRRADAPLPLPPRKLQSQNVFLAAPTHRELLPAEGQGSGCINSPINLVFPVWQPGSPAWKP